MPYSAGTAILDVIPSFRGVQEAIAKEVRQMERALGQQVGDEFGKQAERAVDKALNTSVRKAAKRAATDSASDFAGEFQSQLHRSMRRAQGQLGALKVDAEFDDKNIARQVKVLQKNLERLGQVKIGTDMDAGPALIAAGRIEKKLREIQDAASSLNARVGIGAALEDIEKFRKTVQSQGALEMEIEIKADRQLGAFERLFKARMKTILDAVPPVEIKADSSDIEHKIAAVRAELLSLADAKIGIDLSGSEAIARATAVKEVIDSIGGSRDVDLGLAFDTKAAAAELETFIAAIQAQVGPVEVPITPRLEGAAARLIRTRLEQALSDLAIQPDLVTGEVDREAEALRLRLQDLRDLHINGYLDAGQVIAKAAEIEVLLQHLERDRTDIDLKTNAASALDSIRKITAMGDAMQDTRSWGERLRTTLLGTGSDADASANSFRGFSGVVLGIAAGLPLLVPLLATAGAGVLALGAAGVGAAAGLGVLLFSFSGVGAALKALDADQKAAGNASVQNAQKIRSASDAVATAEQGVSRAREQAGRAAEQAARQVSDAVQSQKDAEQDLVRAQAEVVRAQQEVTRAREEAAQRIQDLKLSIQGGALAERQAVLDLAEAEAKYREVMADPKADAAAREQASIDLERRRLGLQQLRVENGRLAKEQAEANRTGIEGSREVVSAQDGVKRAQQGVADAMRRVSDAGKAVSDAVRDQERTQQDSARAITDAQAAVTKAQQAYTDALFETSTQGSATGRTVEATFGRMGAAGQRFVLFLQATKNQLAGLRDVSQAGIFPGIESAIDSILTRNGPALKRFLADTGQAIGDSFRQFGDLLTSAPWRAIFDDFTRYAPVFITQFGQVGMNLLTFFGGLFQAFAPMAKDFGDWLIVTTGKLRDWALALKGSDQLKTFFAYISETGPRVWALFRDILETVIHIAEGIAPFAGILLGALDSIFSFLAALDPQLIGAITTSILGLTVAFQLAHGAITIFSQGADLMRHPLSRIIFVVGGILTALAALYTTSEPFRNFVDWLVDRVQDLVGVFTGLPGPIQLALTAIGGFALLRGPLSGAITGIKGIMDGLALKALYAKDSVVGIATGAKTAFAERGALGVAKGGLSKFMGFLGGPWGLAIGAGVTALGYLVTALDESGKAADSAKAYQKDLTTALKESKGAIDDNVRAIAAQKAADEKIGDSNLLDIAKQAGVELPKVTDALLGNKDAYAEVKAQLEAYRDAHTWMSADVKGNPVERIDAEGKAAEDALAHLGPLAGAMGGAATTAGNLAEATGDATKSQEELDAAADAVNEALALQQQTMINMYEASKGFDDATKSLAEAHQAVADAIKDEGKQSQAYQDALVALEDQSYRTAQAAGKVAEARHSDAEGAELQLWNNAALLENLRAQEQQYGTLPPRLAELKASLEEQVPAAYQAATQFENLGLNVIAVPDSKTIKIESATADEIKKMEALGLKVEQLPDGTYKVTAATKDAEDALARLTTDRTVSIYAQAKWEGITKRVARENRDFQDQFGLPHKAAGGPIYGPGGPTSDSILARLSNGEYVIKAASVQKYGLGFLHAVNTGAFADGGLVGRIIPKFAGGGLAANWGGTINMTGGDTNPLAQIWFEAIAAINQAAASGSRVIAGHFAGLRNSVKGTLSGLRGEASGIWSGLMNYLVPSAKGMQGNVGGIFSLLQRDTSGKFSSLGSTVRALWAAMTGSVRSETSKTAGHNSTTFGSMRTNTTGIFTDTINKVKSTWNQIAGITQKPINFVINSVLNNGLFKAFNGIVGTLGLPKTWKIPTAQPVPNPKLAAGGRVPGWSASDTHDNIPAWLTANEYVLPVAATRRLRRTVGDEGLESLRRGMLPQFASGGLVALGKRFQQMGARVSEHPAFGGVTPGAHVKGSQHYSGHAIDVNTRPGTSALEQRELTPMMNLARQLGFHVIFMSAGHFNHGHVDDRGGSSGSAGSLTVDTPAWYDLFGSVTGVLKKLQDSISGGDEVDKRFGASGLSGILEAMPGKALGWIWGKAKDTISGLFTNVMDSVKEAASNIFSAFQGNTSVQAAIQGVAGKYGWGSGSEWNALMAIINKESSGNPRAQNPTSTAYGLFQFLNSTWAGVGGYKTDNPALQTEFGIRYIKSRYGTPSKALAFHNSHNWYSEGGDVTNNETYAGHEVPTLYDTGGWLPPGLTTVMNASGRPEPILTADQWDSLLQTGDGGNGGIEHLHIHEVATDIEEAIGAVNHISRVLANGGRYSGRGEY